MILWAQFLPMAASFPPASDQAHKIDLVEFSQQSLELSARQATGWGLL